MPRRDNSADDRTVIAPFRRVVPKLRSENTGTSAPPPTTARSPVRSKRAASKSLLPAVIFAGCAVLLLMAGIGVATVYLLFDPQEPAVTEQSLEEELVAIEQVPIYLPEEAAIIDLSGNPVVLPRRPHSVRRISEVAVEASATSALDIAGPVYRMSDDLLSAEIQLVSGLTAGQQSFAFFQPGASAEDSDVEDTQPDAAQTDGPAFEAEPVAYRVDTEPAGRDATIYRVDSASRLDGPSKQETMLSLVSEEVPAALIARHAWSGEHAMLLEAAMAEVFGIDTLAPGDVVAITGYRSSEEPSLYIPGRLVLYRGQDYVGTLALTDRGEYVEGVDPWFGELPFEDSGEEGALSGSVSLLDAIYGSALRNEVPTDVLGEAILTLSRGYDLSQPVAAADKITLLYTREPRDRSTGFGKILYIAIDRESDAIECYVFQPGREKSFTCVSGDGYAKDTGDGMTTPVSGVLSTRFGPRKDPGTGKVTVHPGVSWVAPAGTAVVAAFPGKVASAGSHPEYGNYLKISHSDGRETAYGHLERFAEHIAPGVEVEAGGLVGYVGTTGKTDEPQLFFQLLRNGHPTDPFGTFQRVIESGGAVDALIQRIIYVESAGNPTARNPLSTATGLGQFIDSTWLRMIRTHRPDLMQGRSREEILALRTDPDLATEMVAALARGNASYLRSNGQSVTPGNLYLSHFLGPEGAVVALSANPETPLAELFPSAVITANPFLTGRSAGYVVEWAARKMRQKAPAVVAAQPRRQEFARNPQFVAMKQAVATMLN